MTIGKTELRLIADKVTGTLYDPEAGRCLSSDARTLEGPAPEGYKLPPKGNAFCFGTQPITNSPKAVLWHGTVSDNKFVAACAPCNRSKGAMTLEQWKAKK